MLSSRRRCVNKFTLRRRETCDDSSNKKLPIEISLTHMQLIQRKKMLRALEGTIMNSCGCHVICCSTLRMNWWNFINGGMFSTKFPMNGEVFCAEFLAMTARINPPPSAPFYVVMRTDEFMAKLNLNMRFALNSSRGA